VSISSTFYERVFRKKFWRQKNFKPKTQLLYLFLQNFVQKMRALNVDEIDTRKLEFHLTYDRVGIKHD